MSRSRSHAQNLWYHRKRLVIRKKYMINMKALTLKVKKIIRKPKMWQTSFPNEGQRSRSRSRAQNLWYHWKGLVKRNTNAKYKSPISLKIKKL